MNRHARRATTVVVAAACLLLSTSAFAEKTIWHYDQLDPDMNVLANGLKQHPLSAHPGFVKGEAFGLLFKPKPEDYPVKILSVEFVMASPPNVSTNPSIPVVIEVWNDDSVLPAPSSDKPIWSVTTADFANGPQIGQDVVGNNGMIYEFDWSDPENHPPEITQGNIRIMIRFQNDGQNLQTEWGNIGCIKENIPGLGEIGCGCQKLAPLTDNETTVGVNLMHIWLQQGSVGSISCDLSGPPTWRFVEQVANDGLNMKGDFILRMGVEGVGNVGPGPDAGGGGSDAGSTADAGGGVADAGPPAKPVIDSVTPASAPNNETTEIKIFGTGFADGVKVKLGTESLPVDIATPTEIRAIVFAGVSPGTYAIKVENPDGQVGFLDAAFEVTEPAEEDAGGEPDAAPVDAGTPDMGPTGPSLDVVSVSPSCATPGEETEVRVYGEGFDDTTVFKLGGAQLVGVTIESNGAVAVGLLPPGLETGTHSLVVERGTTSKVLANAIEVGVCGAGVSTNGASSGCTVASASGGAGRGVGVVVALMALLGAVALRRRYA